MLEYDDDNCEQQQLNIFEEPEGYYPPPPPPTFQTFRLKNGHGFSLRLVGQSPLWGHHIWQAATVIARFLEDCSDLYLVGKSVLEFGAGAGLPSLVACIKGAKVTVVTDYPENQLIDNLQYNIDTCLGLDKARISPIFAQGYKWGANPTPLLSHTTLGPPGSGVERFNTLILADLLFNHACHVSLLESIIETLAREESASALIFFTPYRPWLLDKDMAFFDLVRQDGRFNVIELGKWMMEKVMFKDDRGDETLRRTVFGFEIKWRPDVLPDP